MKKVMLVISLILLMVSSVYADVLTTSSDNVFVKDAEKVITVAMPNNCSAMNGTLVLNNCELVSLTENYATKELDSNIDKFIVYGLNKDVMVGENLVITIKVSNNENATVSIIDCVGATPDAQAIQIDNFNIVLSNIYDVNNDGILNSDDVLFVINGIYEGNLSVVDLQKIINALLEEM